jgi:hypothetical protein
MKHLLKLLLVSTIFLSVASKAQLDTLHYLKTNFEIQKSEYIGKPFSYLLSKMTQIQPKTAWSHSPHFNKNIRTYTLFRFPIMEASFYNAVTLRIVWETPLPSSETKNLSNLNGFYFTNDERNYYGNKIVKDIQVYR